MVGGLPAAKCVTWRSFLAPRASWGFWMHPHRGIMRVLEKLTIVVIWAAVPLTIALPLAFNTRLVLLNTDAAADVGRTLILLIFTSLIVERALEAVISAWREPRKRT